MSTTYETHEIAEIFPAMDGADFASLKSDIESRGLIEPVWLYQDKILDGRNRYRACSELGVEPEVRVYYGTDPIGFAVSLNLRRRHLSISQRAMIADRITNLGKGQHHPTAPDAQICASREVIPPPVSQEAAAKALSVSRRSVQHARNVNEKAAPKLKAAVEKGEVTVAAASAVADLPPAEQEAAVEKGEVKAKAKEVRKGKSKVNGVLTEDPADVGELRANGKIHPDTVVEVTSRGREPGEDDSGPIADPEESSLDDRKWLESLASRKTIDPACLNTFDADALLYRALEQPRKTFAHHATRAISKARRKAFYAYYVNRFLAIDHPRHWLRCPQPAMDAGAGCGGGGYLEFGGKRQQCPKCLGRGYWVK